MLLNSDSVEHLSHISFRLMDPPPSEPERETRLIGPEVLASGFDVDNAMFEMDDASGSLVLLVLIFLYCSLC